jgi:hypothetical protein
MITGTIHEQQDELLGVLLGLCLEENLEAFDASSLVSLRYGSMKFAVFTSSAALAAVTISAVNAPNNIVLISAP